MKIEPGKVYYLGTTPFNAQPVEFETLDFGDGKDSILVLHFDPETLLVKTEELFEFVEILSQKAIEHGTKSLFVLLPKGMTLEWIRRPQPDDASPHLT